MGIILFFTHDFITRFCNLVLFDPSEIIINAESPLTTDILLLLNPLDYPDDHTIRFYPHLYSDHINCPCRISSNWKGWAMAKVHSIHYFSKTKVKCQVVSNFFSITNSIIHLEYSFLLFRPRERCSQQLESKDTYPVWAPGH